MQEPIEVTGLWLRVGRDGVEDHWDRVEVLVEVDGQWREVLNERIMDGPISHIVEPSLIRDAAAPEWLR